MNKSGDKIRKRALFGVAVLGVAAIVTVGVVTIKQEEQDQATYPPLVDLNSGESGLVSRREEGTAAPTVIPKADRTQEQETKLPDPPEATKAPEPPTSQVTEREPEPEPKTGATSEPTEVAEGTGGTTGETGKSASEENPTAPVTNPQVIAASLDFNKDGGLCWPVYGQVIIPYSPDHGVFHFTLEQFRTSNAVVLSAEVGSPVVAAAKGVVTEITENVRTGNTVKLALGNDITLVYGQLALDGLAVGDIVEEGECIGTVAEPTRYYVVEGGNLYFQVWEGEESLNPMLLLRGEMTEE